jgi:ATP-dependent helicase/nuclease subunit B
MGRAGSGKTEYMLFKLKEAFKGGRNCLYIVPEQQSLSSEKRLSEYLGDCYNMGIEVLNFERLPNRIAREYGNLAVSYIDDGGRDILMSRVLEQLSDKLCEYKSVSTDSDFVKSIITVINKFKAGDVSFEKLAEAAESGEVRSNSRLYAKLKDISLIYKEYQKLFTEELCDPCDALTSLAVQLDTRRFFKDYTVFIDGYYTFTEQEYAIIERIIKQSPDTYISFTCDSADTPLFTENRKCADRIKRYAGADCEDIYTGNCKRHFSPMLAHIEQQLWEAETVPFDGSNDGSVKIMRAENAFDEAEAITSEIIRLTREKGLRYREISVVFGDITEYEGIIDAVFERNKIPFYMATKDELSTKPLFSFVFACLDAIIADFPVSSIKQYVKTGFTPLTVEESDIMLRYAEMWNIRGKQWYSDEKWQMNPEGYSERFSKYDEHVLAKANGARDKIMPYLSDLRQTLTQKNITVGEAIEALYKHLIDTEVDKKLLEKAQYLRDIGDEEESQKERQLWEMLVSIFDQLHKLCGSDKVSLPKLREMIKLLSDEYTVGSIPTSADQIRIGSAALFRADTSCRAQILGGVTDGVFPAYAGGDSFFDDDELMLLEEAGCSIGENRFEQQNRERFLFYAAAVAPKEFLILTYPSSDFTGAQKRPSIAVNRILKLLPDGKTVNFGADEADYLYSKETVAFFFKTVKEKALKKLTEKVLIDNGINPGREAAPLFDENAVIKTNKNGQVFFSPSSIERYNYCPFSYFTAYELRLKKNKKIKFATPEIGTFIHKILEQFVSERVQNGRFIVPDEQGIKQSVDALAREYFLNILGGEEGKNRRFMHTYENLKKTLNLLLHNISDEFSQSDFVPSGFEVKIGYNEPESLPPLEHTLENGGKVLVRGSIDRVDTYKKNGVTYVRVVDYKTYSKGFSLELVDEGLDTQMLNYLFAYCNAGENRKPAGILYSAAKLPTVKVDGGEDGDEIRKKIYTALKRTGILLKDKDIAGAMDKSGSGVYVPVKFKKDGDFDSRCEHNLLDSEGFAELEKKLQKQIKTLAERVLKGDMCIAPKKIDDIHDACKHCDYGSICRYSE